MLSINVAISCEGVGCEFGGARPDFFHRSIVDRKDGDNFDPVLASAMRLRNTRGKRNSEKVELKDQHENQQESAFSRQNCTQGVSTFSCNTSAPEN